jgi:hypothetical protein
MREMYECHLTETFMWGIYPAIHNVLMTRGITVELTVSQLYI